MFYKYKDLEGIDFHFIVLCLVCVDVLTFKDKTYIYFDNEPFLQILPNEEKEAKAMVQYTHDYNMCGY